MQFLGRSSRPWGKPRFEDALRLADFGVKAGDFLALQKLLPTVTAGSKGDVRALKWETRETGHAGNWTEDNVRFCLATFLDVAIKTQHAPWLPWAASFHYIYVDTLTAKHDEATVWREPSALERFADTTIDRVAVKTLKKGDVLRGVLGPRPDPRAAAGTFGALATPSFENAAAYWFYSDDVSGVVFREDFEVGTEPHDTPAHRRLYPHLFPAS